MNFNLKCEAYNENLISRKESIDFFGSMKVSYLFRFENGYGASVIKGRGTYGFDQDLWELAVIKFAVDCDDYILDYDTPITDDVVGYQNDGEVLELLERIKNLPLEG